MRKVLGKKDAKGTIHTRDGGVGHEREARSRKNCVVDFAVLVTS